MDMNKKLDTETGKFIALALCVKALRGSFGSASKLQRAIAFWPLIGGALFLYGIHGFDNIGLGCALSVLLPFFIIAAVGWGNETTEWAEDVVRTLPKFSPLPPIKLPDFVVKYFTRTIPVPLSPPRFILT